MTGIFIIIAVAVGYIVYVLFIRPKLIAKRTLALIKEANRNKLENISENGFTKYTEHVPEKVTWSSVRSIEIKEDNGIDIILRTGKVIEIFSDNHQRLEFLRKVPAGIEKFDYEGVQNFFNNLKPCKICGFYAIETDECLNCTFSIEDEKEWKEEGKSKEEYYKEEQLDYLTIYFDTNDPVEKTLKEVYHSEVFKHNPNWKLYPTKKEIEEEKQKWNE
jgi:hypothetical protein